MESSLPSPFEPSQLAARQRLQTLSSEGLITPLYHRLLRQNKLVAASCRECQHTHFPPKSRCPRCYATELEPIFLSGRGQLHSMARPESPEELSTGHILLEEGFWVRALLVKIPQSLGTGVDLLESDLLENGAIEVRSHVLCTQGVSILAFQPLPIARLR